VAAGKNIARRHRHYPRLVDPQAGQAFGESAAVAVYTWHRRLNTPLKSGARKMLPSGCKALVLSIVGIICALLPCGAGAQIKSNPGAVNLTATLNTSITISAAPGAVNFALVRNGVATGSTTVSIVTSWVVPVLFGNVTEYAYFTSPVTALTDGGGDNIPSSSVSGSFNGGAYTAFTGTSPFGAGSSITLFNQFITIFLNSTGTRTDTLGLQISTVGLNLPAGVYTGVLHIQAQSN
jgi:hypothetical protein